MKTPKHPIESCGGFRGQRLRSPLLPPPEQLESRIAPATLINPLKITYQDADGDTVTVTFSRPILDAGNVNNVFTFDVGTVDGSNATKQQLRTIDLTSLVNVPAGLSITTTAKASKSTGGDGLAALGELIATGIDLGTVRIDGDLGRIVSGDTVAPGPGLAKLIVHSMGQYDTSTGATSLAVRIAGDLGALKVKTDVRGVDFRTTDNGDIGKVVIGGSLIGGNGFASGRIFAARDIGSVTIQGDIIGGSGQASGGVTAGRDMGKAVVGGSIFGGTAPNFSGFLFANNDIGVALVKGDVVGGSGLQSGIIHAFGGTLKSATILGSLIGGDGNRSAEIFVGKSAGLVRVGGSAIGGLGDNSGAIRINEAAGSITIGGNLVGGSTTGADNLSQSGYVEAQRIGKFFLGRSLIAGINDTTGTFANNGAIRVEDDLGVMTINGSVIGNATNQAIISARGQATPTAGKDLAIGSLNIKGGVAFASILAGVGVTGLSLNADAQIGAVTVRGDWIASSLAAGAAPGGNGFFGDGDDVKMSGGGVKDDAAIVSTIARITIGGQLLGTPASINAADHFGFVAQLIGKVKITGNPIPLNLGVSNDNLTVGITGDFAIREV